MHWYLVINMSGKIKKEIQEMCKRLRCPGIYQSYERIAKNYNVPEYEKFLFEVLKAEIESREENNRIKRIKKAKFPVIKTFGELEKEELPDDAKNHLEKIKNLEFLKENRNLIMLGNSGTGKTHLAVAAGIEACNNGYTVLFKTAAGLINELKEAKNEKELTKYAKTFKKIDLLILDEMGYISFDLEGAELLFQYISMRYEVKSTIITTNLNFSNWIKIFKDKALTMALLDRITHNAIILDMNGYSYRRKALKQNNKS